MRQLALELASPPAPSLDNFVAGQNAELLAALRALADPGEGERFVYFWGPPGCGKSHLIAAAAGALKAAGRPIESIGNGAQLLAAHDESPGAGLAIDDVHLLSAAGQAELFKRYNTVRERGGALLASGDAPPAGLKLRADLVTRLGWGLVYQLHPLSDQEKAAALAEHARSRGLPVSTEVINYVLARQRRDLPHLIALLDALDRYSLESKRAITVPLVRELLTANDASR
ncbi:MAG: DnaA regulatory inactivator Hda [Burkholderiales bacterium]